MYEVYGLEGSSKMIGLGGPHTTYSRISQNGQ